MMKIVLNTGLLISLVASANAANELDKNLVAAIKESTQAKGDVNPVTHAEKDKSSVSLPAAGEGVVEDPTALPEEENVINSAQAPNEVRDELHKKEAVDDMQFGPLTSDGGEESNDKDALDKALYEHAATLFQNANITSN